MSQCFFRLPTNPLLKQEADTVLIALQDSYLLGSDDRISESANLRLIRSP
jgi:hypothetical protein